MSRSILNPILTTAAILTAVSGLLILIHYESYFTKALHEIAALILVVSAITHIVLNWKPLKKTLGKRFYIWSAAIALCILVMLAMGSFDYALEHGIQECMEFFEAR